MSSEVKRDPYRLTGTTLDGKYLLEEYTGSGGMGAVYRGLQIDSSQQVAIKILKPDVVVGHPEYVGLFEREVKAVQGLSHPHIVKLLDSGTDQDISYMVMEWLEGPTLEEVISKGQLSTDRIIRIFGQICDAFAVAHGNHIIHLDVKPANIMVLSDEQPDDFIKVIDFGMARVLTRDSGTTATRFLGTYQYCSPEHFGGVVSHLSDIYSLGVTLYNMATGVIPFGTSYINAKRHPNLELPPVPSVRGIRPELPTAVDQVIRKALNRSPKERQGSARQLFEDFSKAVGIDTAKPAPESSTGQTTFIKGGYSRRSLINAWQKLAIRGRLLGALAVLMISSIVVTVLYLNRSTLKHSKDPNNQEVLQQVAPQPNQTAAGVNSPPQPAPISSSSPDEPEFGPTASQPQAANNTSISSSSTKTVAPSITSSSPEISRPLDDISSPQPTVEPRLIEPATDALPKAESTVGNERRVFDLINSQRRARGEKPLLWDDKLAALASRHSEDMVLNNYFSHQDRNGRGLPARVIELGINGWKKLGENIAYTKGYDDPEVHAVERWMDSEKHRANILRKDFTHTGVGVAQDKDGKNYITQVFMKR